MWVVTRRSSLLDAPEAPEELRRLAWQTDQMRRRSENDQAGLRQFVQGMGGL